MRASAPYRLTERRQAILRQASAALRGRMDTLWRRASGFAVADQATVYLCTALAVVDTSLERVRKARGLTTASRAHLLADLAVIAEAIEGALEA